MHRILLILPVYFLMAFDIPPNEVCSHPPLEPFEHVCSHSHVCAHAPMHIAQNGSWQSGGGAGGNTPFQRHENGFVEVNGKIYLLGGRGGTIVQEYDPVSNSWSNKAGLPFEMHHMQAVAWGGKIYVVGAFTGGFPDEVGIDNVQIYDPGSNSWSTGPSIPRKRGSAGAVVYNNKIYVICGITNGHQSGHVNWFDVFDPSNNSWQQLPGAPRARDHFHAAIVGNKLIVAGGRRSKFNNGGLHSDLVGEVDIFDFGSNSWSTAGQQIPTKRGGTTSVAVNGEVFVIGGESGSQSNAYSQTEAFNVNNQSWRNVDGLNLGRHGTQAVNYQNTIYIAAGSKQVGADEINGSDNNFLEKLVCGPPTGGDDPVAAFTANPTFGPAPLTVNFDASASQAGSGSITNYAWNFGDGNTDNGQFENHTYFNNGTYIATLTVTNSEGNSDSETATITVGNPGANIWIEGECGNAGASWNTALDLGASEGAFLQTTPEFISNPNNIQDQHKIEYQFNASQAGTYSLWARVRAPSGNFNSLWLLINGTWTRQNFSTGNSWNWQQMDDVNLNQGNNTLELAKREGVDLDKIVLSQIPGFSPSGQGENAPNCGGQQNSPPVIAAIANQTDQTGNFASLQVNASDPDGDDITFQASGLPNGLNINSNSGLISGNITAAPGTYQVSVTATDDGIPNLSDVENFEWTITGTPLPGDTLWIEAECASFGNEWSLSNSIAASNGEFLTTSGPTISSPNNIGPQQELSFAFDVANAGTYSLWMRIITQSGYNSLWQLVNGNWQKLEFANNSNWTWVQIQSSSLSAGTQTFRFARREGADIDKVVLSSTNNFVPTGIGGNAEDCSPSNDNDPPILQAIPNQSDVEGASVNLQLNGSDPNGDGLSFAATGLPLGLSINSNNGRISGILAANPGNYAVTVTLTDDGVPPLSDSRNFTWTVTEVGNDPVRINLEAECANFGNSWSSEAGNGVSGGEFIQTNPGFVNSGNISNANIVRFGAAIPEADTYQIWLRARTSGGYNSIWQQVNGVWNQIDFPNNSNWTWYQLNDLDFSTGQEEVLLAKREGADIDKILLTNDPGFSPTGLETVGSNCDGSTNSPPILDPIANQSHPINTPISFFSSATDPNGDNVTYSATGLPPGISINAVSGEISGTTPTSPGFFSSQIFATDDADTPLSDSESFSWTIFDESNQSEFWWEAECLTFGSAWSEGSAGSASEGQYIFTNPQNISSNNITSQHTIEAQASISQAGTYASWVRVRTAAGYNSLWQLVNNSWVKIDFPNHNSWQWHQLNNLTLNNGSQQIMLAKREGVDVDKLLLTSDLQFTPQNLGGQAEACQSNRNFPEDELLTIYPNPFISYINLDWKGERESARVLFLNGMGQEVWKGAIVLEGSQHLEVRDLPPGIYKMLIIGKGFTLGRNIIKIETFFD